MTYVMDYASFDDGADQYVECVEAELNLDVRGGQITALWIVEATISGKPRTRDELIGWFGKETVLKAESAIDHTRLYEKLADAA